MSTKIEWATDSWNPITGCTPVSEGCQNCYAKRMSKRLAGRCGYDRDNPFNVTRHLDKMDEPLHWRKPRRVFVCSMGDLFHPDVEDWMLDEIFGVILGCRIFNNTPDHVFMVLTKRPGRMQGYFASRTPVELLRAWSDACPCYTDDPDVTVEDIVYSATCRDWDENGRNSSGSEYKPWGYLNKIWPLPNLWLGVTAENQARADERIPILLQTPAAKRFVSIEPMLGPINLRHMDVDEAGCKEWCQIDALTGEHTDMCRPCPDVPHLDWVICGSESGPGKRPMRPEWAFELMRQCRGAAVPFFYKQGPDDYGIYQKMPELDGQVRGEIPGVSV
ncbi:MAG: phage Gp37/Gp68 family protein [Syntrophomonadaceae bacterium]|nr:phage Gp37/Gp68 family protein [Syntrophomonadaceae bacterium]